MIQVGDLAIITQSTDTSEIGKMCLVLKNHEYSKGAYWIQILETGTKHAYHQNKLIKLGDQNE